MTEREPKIIAPLSDPAGPWSHIIGGEIDPVGPVNVFNEKLASADGINRAVAIATEYDAAHPATPFPPPDRTPIGAPIDPGRPIIPNPTKYVIDSGPRVRLTRKRWR